MHGGSDDLCGETTDTHAGQGRSGGVQLEVPVAGLGVCFGKVGDVLLLWKGAREIVDGLVPVSSGELVEDALVECALEKLLHLGSAKGGCVVVEEVLEVVEAGGKVGLGRHGLLVVLDLELVCCLVELALDGFLSGLKL